MCFECGDGSAGQMLQTFLCVYLLICGFGGGFVCFSICTLGKVNRIANRHGCLLDFFTLFYLFIF